MSMTATITTSSWSDTLNSTPVSGIDTVWTDAPNTMQSTVRSSDDENLLQTSDVYYPSSGTVGQFENSNAGVVIAVAIGATDQYTEMSIYGTDWADGTAAFVSDTAGYYGSLRQPAGGAAGGTSGPGVTALMGHGGGSTAFLMTGSDPCTAIKVTIIGLGVATAGLLVAGVMLSSSAPPFGAIAARYMYKRALVTAATMITTVGLLVGCEALHPEYYPH